jgi:hypothetical protein
VKLIGPVIEGISKNNDEDYRVVEEAKQGLEGFKRLMKT